MSEAFSSVDLGSGAEVVVECGYRREDDGSITMLWCKRYPAPPPTAERRFYVVKQTPRQKTVIRHDDATGFYQRAGKR